MIDSVKINDYNVSFLDSVKFNNGYKCIIVATNSHLKVHSILLNNEDDFNKIKNLALSVTNRKFSNITYPAIIRGFTYNDMVSEAKWF